MQAVSCLALRTRRRNALCVIRNPRRGFPLAPITLAFADNREVAVARAEEGQGELANNHLGSCKLFGVDIDFWRRYSITDIDYKLWRR